MVPDSSMPDGNCSASCGQGSSPTCFRPRLMRRCSLSMDRITTSTVSPFLSTSLGWATRLVHDMSETCTRPSMPSSSSTKAPKLVRLRTFPLTRMPGGYFSSSVSHGSGSICFRPSEIFSLALSTLSTTASMTSPMLTTFDGCRTCRVQDISETWIRPSTPFSSSTKAP